MTISLLHLGDQLSAHPVAALAAVFAGALLTSLTPCLYPMIPIAVAVIGGGATVPTRSRRIGLALLYAAGFAAAYSSLGILAAMSGHMFGEVSIPALAPSRTSMRRCGRPCPTDRASR